MLLRTEGARLAGDVQAFGAIQCCAQFMQAKRGQLQPPPRPMKLRLPKLYHGQRLGSDFVASAAVAVNTRWPLASEEWQDFAHSFGANIFHFRFAPWYGDADHESEWGDLGGPMLGAGPDFNPAFWAKARVLAYHALEQGSYVEVVPMDTWYGKVCQWGTQPCAMLPEDVDAIGRRPSPGQERFIRKVVEELGCFGNVIWATDNEGGEIQGTTRAWYEWVRTVIRDEEQRSGCGFVHMIGIDTPQFADGPFDYASTHERAALTQPIAGKWSINNERNPAFSPEQEAANFKTARDVGLAYFYWRAEMSDAEQLQTLGLFRDVVNGAQTGCFAPDPDDPKWVWTGDGTGVPQATIWLNEAKAIVGDPKLMPGATVWDRALEAMRRLGVEIRKAGHCASGPWKDAVVVKSGEFWIEFHPVALTDGGYTGTPWKGNAWAYPAPTPDPTPTPSPMPTPAPPPEACPFAVPQTVYIWCKDYTAWEDGRRWDCTAQQKRQPGGAPVWPEGPDRAACELKSAGGPPDLSIGNTGLLVFKRLTNPWQFYLGGMGYANLHCYVPVSPGVDLCGYVVSIP